MLIDMECLYQQLSEEMPGCIGAGQQQQLAQTSSWVPQKRKNQILLCKHFEFS